MRNEEWDASDAGRQLLAESARAVASEWAMARSSGRLPADADVARAVLHCARRSLALLNEDLNDESEDRMIASLLSRADEIITVARSDVAEQIAAAIEHSACEPPPGHEYCTDCAKWEQAKQDAAAARRIGGRNEQGRPAGQAHAAQPGT